ncbi:MAG: ribosome-associated translation inhibitor RaiA [Rhodobacteraceae bacterium]|nr:ribosome-associated translation inhibitor RaiA [Paracoccaceae bacterium]MBL4557435.1 ribosome-associated translation inhibitor RaiA [Paracoccaceae bacterium]HBG97750.1 ribosome-associated translation inhibitor RaiA [Paracoccaceae bacterium]
MKYQISGKQIDIGDALRTHVTDNLGAAIGKYAERPTDAQVVFSRDRHEYVCETVVHLSTGLTAQARAHATEIYAAFDLCCDKMETQLRRYKRRLKNHHRQRQEPIEAIMASAYVLEHRAHSTDEAEPDDLQPVIVAEMEARVPSLSVGEAVMQMELAGAPVLVFQNDSQDRINVVYRRDDGNIGWIDPRQTG